MDRNSVIGLFLIGLLIIAYSIYTQPSDEERKAMQHRADSITQVRNAEQLRTLEQQKIRDSATAIAAPVYDDSTRKARAMQEYGDFSASASGTEQIFTVENDLFKIVLTNKGG